MTHTADSLPAFFKTRIQQLPVAASERPWRRATAGRTNQSTGRGLTAAVIGGESRNQPIDLEKTGLLVRVADV